jgi:cytochrome P450
MTYTEIPAAESPRLATPLGYSPRIGKWRQILNLRRCLVAAYGPEVYEQEITRWQVFSRTYLLLNSPDAIKRVLADNAGNYVKGPLYRRMIQPGLGQGSFSAEGEAWRKHRGAIAPVFHPRKLESFAPTMIAKIHAMRDEWDQQAGASLDIGREMAKLTVSIILGAMFSSDASEDFDKIEASFACYRERIKPGVAELLFLSRWTERFTSARARDAFHSIDDMISHMIASRKGNRDQEDLLDTLLALQDAAGSDFTRSDVRDELITILFVGHETTALALAWTWYVLALHPHVEARVHEEVDRVLGGAVPVFAHLDQLPYTRATLQESMRLYPPFPVFSRMALGEDAVAGHRVRAGSVMLISPWVLHRHRRLWPDPDSFNPERFMGDNSERRSRYAYLPFGAGARACAGMAFATMEAMLVIATMAQKFRLVLEAGHAIEPTGVTTLRPSSGPFMRAVRRSS